METRKNNLFISDILSRSFNLCKDNFIEIIKAIAVFLLPVTIIQNIIDKDKVVTFDFSDKFYKVAINQDPYYLEKIINNIDFGGIAMLILVGFIISIVSFFGYLVIMKIVDYADKNEDVSWISAIKYVWKKKWSLLGLNILFYIMLIAGTIAFTILSIMIALITLGIGLILIIPLWIFVFLVLLPSTYLFNSTMLVRDLGVIDSIRETFLLFRRGYFWSTIGKLSAISGIVFGLAIVMGILSLIPVIGEIIGIIGGYAIAIYLIAYINVFVLDRNKPNIDSFGGDNNSGENLIDPII